MNPKKLAEILETERNPEALRRYLDSEAWNPVGLPPEPDAHVLTIDAYGKQYVCRFTGYRPNGEMRWELKIAAYGMLLTGIRYWRYLPKGPEDIRYNPAFPIGPNPRH